jgi:hypothetical protein
MIQVSQIAQALDIHGLIIYLAGMTFILGALVFANHADDGLRALSPLIRRSVRPLSERQGDAHCGFAYFVGEHAILDRARQHHTANA